MSSAVEGGDSAVAISTTISVWGSCVSRDTLGYMPECNVGEYVARQSAIVTLAPARNVEVPLHLLESQFQRRMLVGDTQADASRRIQRSEADYVLLDLVDERSGVWQFRDGTFLTNSVEAYRTGVNEWAPALGARLIEFGTDEHYELWREAFSNLMPNLRRHAPLLLLDIAWASALVGQKSPRGVRYRAGSLSRRIRRSIRDFGRARSDSAPITSTISRLAKPHPSSTAQRAAHARAANKRYRRYAKFASTMVTASVALEEDEVRMDPNNQWGLAPYHYRESDYLQIVSSIRLYSKGWSI